MPFRRSCRPKRVSPLLLNFCLGIKWPRPSPGRGGGGSAVINTRCRHGFRNLLSEQ